MTKNRQAIADAALLDRAQDFSLQATCRAWGRRLAFSVPPIRRFVERQKRVRESAERWNSLISQTNYETYLGGTINVDACNALASTLIKYHAPTSPSVLDVGCCGGTMLSSLPSFSRYLGTDISSYAIGEAEADPDLSSFVLSGRASFKATDLRDYQPSQKWDVIIFNEVLYYLTCDEAIAECERYSRSLSRDGVILVAMKDDGKSRTIFGGLGKSLSWVDGMLWQRKAIRHDFKVRVNRERPAMLLGVFRIPESGRRDAFAQMQ